MWILYQLLLLGAAAVAAPVLLLWRGRHYLPTVPGRCGSYTGEVPRHGLWLHAVSVGEARVAATLARQVDEAIPLLLTTVTPTGQAEARRLAPRRCAVAYLPFDLGWPIRRFLSRFEPAACVLVEGDYWPLLLHHLSRRKTPVFVVNGRISDRSFARMRRLTPLLRPLFGPVLHFAMQTEDDRRRLVALGVDPDRISVTGNLKFDAAAAAPLPELEALVGRLAAGRPVLVAGSTMSEEEAQVLDAFDRLGGGRRALLILAPRHPERWPDVEALIVRRGYRLARRSRPEDVAAPDVLLLDTLGELAAVYALGAGAFVGGSLVPTGGHNPLEPAAHDVPVAVGPFMDNFREIARLFDDTEAWARVRDASELAATWEAWLESPEAARALGGRAGRTLRANRGGVARTLAILTPALEGLRAASGA